MVRFIFDTSVLWIKSVYQRNVNHDNLPSIFLSQVNSCLLKFRCYTNILGFFNNTGHLKYIKLHFNNRTYNMYIVLAY